MVYDPQSCCLTENTDTGCLIYEKCLVPLHLILDMMTLFWYKQLLHCLPISTCHGSYYVALWGATTHVTDDSSAWNERSKQAHQKLCTGGGKHITVRAGSSLWEYSLSIIMRSGVLRALAMRPDGNGVRQITSDLDLSNKSGQKIKNLPEWIMPCFSSV